MAPLGGTAPYSRAQASSSPFPLAAPVGKRWRGALLGKSAPQVLLSRLSSSPPLALVDCARQCLFRTVFFPPPRSSLSLSLHPSGSSSACENLISLNCNEHSGKELKMAGCGLLGGSKDLEGEGRGVCFASPICIFPSPFLPYFLFSPQFLQMPFPVLMLVGLSWSALELDGRQGKMADTASFANNCHLGVGVPPEFAYLGLLHTCRSLGLAACCTVQFRRGDIAAW